MAFRITYDEIREMILRTVLSIPVAKEICRRAGLPYGVSGSGLQELVDLFWADPWYNYPYYGGFFGPYRPDPVYETFGSSRKDMLRKKSDDDFDVKWSIDLSYLQLQPIASYEIFTYSPVKWGDGGEYVPGANFTAPPWGFWFRPFVASVPDAGYTYGYNPPSFVGAGDGTTKSDFFDGSNRTYDFFPYVTGRTVYDPFPYPELPCYFYGDLKHVTSLLVYYNVLRNTEQFGVGTGSSPVYIAPVGQFPGIPRVVTTEDITQYLRPANYNATTQPVYLYVMGSIDGGDTWEYMFNRGAEDPVFPEPANLSGSQNISTGFLPSRAFGGGGRLRFKFRRDNVMMKMVLTTQSLEDRIYLCGHGVRGHFRTQF